ncbi:MAG: alpha/beta hydrolase, partial [Bryobacteraceae bacterium]
LALHVSAAPGGGLQATFDSLDQHASGIPVDEIRLELNIVRFSLKQAGATFQGKLIGDSIDGEFRQSGFAMKLVFHRGVAEGPKRPQNPVPPYPYISEAAEFQNRAAGITLAGTFTIPREAESAAKTRKPPAAVLIVGSGPNDRDESILGHKPFLVLADYLTRHGIAVLRYDKRGVGQSKGVYKTATSADFAADASAAVDSLLARPDIDHRRIGLIGHSEGGILAPMVAAERKDIAFVVLLAGTGVNGERVVLDQTDTMSRSEGMIEAEIAKQHKRVERVVAILKAERSIPAAEKKIHDEFGYSPEVDRLLLHNDAWSRYFLNYDPATALEKLKMPVLALIGGLDMQVAPDENLAAIAAALKKGGNDRFTTLRLPGLNHLFQTAVTGAPSEYGRIEETIAPVALETITQWIRRQTGLEKK